MTNVHQADELFGLAAVDNPFSADRIRPGELPYLFSHEDETTDPSRLDSLLDSWRADGYIGQIVGAHGCGKTTLSHAIARRAVEGSNHPFDSATSLTIRAKSELRPASALSWLTRLLRLRSFDVVAGQSIEHTGQAGTLGSQSKQCVLLIDGIDRLTLMQQAVMFHSLRRRQVAALFTTHRVSQRLPLFGSACPVLFRAGSDVQVFAKIVNLMTESCEPLDDAVVEDAFQSCHGNVREALMKLYDAFESRDSC